MDNTLLNSINWETIGFWLLALISGIAISESAKKCKEEGHPRLGILVFLVGALLSCIISSYVLKAGLLQGIINQENTIFITIGIIAIIIVIVAGAYFFGSFWGTFGMFVPGLALGWFGGQTIVTHNLNNIAVAIVCFILGLVIRTLSQTKKN